MKFHCDSGTNMRNETACSTIRLDRFVQITNFLHFADNNYMDETDKLWKLRLLIERLQNNFAKNFVPMPSLSFDKSRIVYYGSHGCKQLLKGKPIN